MTVNPNDVILWNSPKFGNKELELVSKVLKSGYVSEGPMTKELETKLSKIVGTKYVIMTTNATAALYLAIEADKRIKKYSAGTVVIPNLTFVATKNAVEMANLKIEYANVSQDNFMLQLNKNGKMPRIVIPVNLLGRGINDINMKGESIPTLIMDNAGCLGSKVPNGKVGCYSLQANKLLTCGQGGFCATDDYDYAQKIRQLKDFGRLDKYDQDTTGFNFKFNDIQAAVVLGQLEQLEERKELHRKQYFRYFEELSDYGRFMNYNFLDGEVPLWIEFFPNGYHEELFEYLKQNGVECRKPWKPLVEGLYLNTDYYSRYCLWLPNGVSLKPKGLNRVISLVKKFYENK